MMLRPRAIHEHFVSRAYFRIYLSDCLQILHTTLLHVLVGPVVPFGVYELCPIFGSVGPYNDLFRRFDTHFFPEQISKTTGPITVILAI